MLNDIDLEKLNSDLTAITQSSKTYQNNLQIVLDRFQDLLERYNSLKSDYEEEKAGRERYKRQAKLRVSLDDSIRKMRGLDFETEQQNRTVPDSGP
jgi:hypothetical protein